MENEYLVTRADSKCSRCGAFVPLNAQAGQCPACALTLLLEPEPVEVLPESGKPFGPYQLLEKLGEGGMGVVWKARQQTPQRVVALKLIKGGWLASEKEMARFRAEFEAAASFDHPNIVPIYEVGEQDDHLYYTMKLVEGGSLAERIAGNKVETWDSGSERTAPSALSQAHSPGLPGRHRLSQRRVAELMFTICGAVHSAHQHGVIHRDLKPSNILLDRQGQPHIADFGLAKRLTADSGLTLSECVLGSVHYLAPEQAAGKARDITTGADTYSLGVILYEMLTGRVPFAGETPIETLHLVAGQTPVSPSALNANVSRDLETICLKCLEKTPSARYASADALAADLDRWLKGEPILARPTSQWERAVKWVRRNPVTTILSVALILSMAIGLGTALVQLGQTERARQRAVANVEKTLESITRYLTIVEEDPQWRGIRDMGVRNYEMRKALLQITVPLLNELDEPISKNAGLNYRRAAAYRRVAEWNFFLGLTYDAITNASHARDLFQALADAQPHSSVPRREWADTASLLARMFWLPGLDRETLGAHREAILLNEQLVANFPGESIHRHRLAASRADYAIFLCDPILYPSRLREGIALYEEMVGEFGRLMAVEPESSEPKRAFARMTLDVETRLASADTFDSARTNALLRALLPARQLAQGNEPPLEDAALLGGLQSLLGEYQLRSAQWAAAAHNLREAAAIWNKLVDAVPTEMPYLRGEATVQNRLARLLILTGQSVEGEQAAQNAASFLERHLIRFPFDSVTHQQLVATYDATARSFEEAGRYPQAVALRRKTLPLLEQIVMDRPDLTPPRAALAVQQLRLAEVLIQNGQPAEALDLLTQAQSHYQQLVASFPQDAAWQEKLAQTRALLERLK